MTTDGRHAHANDFIEAESAGRDRMGLGRVKTDRACQFNSGGINCLLANAQDFTGTREFADDVCLAAVELLEERPANA